MEDREKTERESSGRVIVCIYFAVNLQSMSEGAEEILKCSHLRQISRRSHLRRDNAVPQHRQSGQAEDFHSDRHRSDEPQQDTRPSAELPVLEASAEEDAGKGEQSSQVCHAQVEEQDRAGLGAATRVPHQDQQEQEVTSDPNHEGDHADHGQHHGEGDGGVCGDGVEKQVDYGRHGTSEAPASATDRNWNETTEQMNNGQMRNFSTLVLMTNNSRIIHLHIRFHSRGPKLPEIPISLCSDDSDIPQPRILPSPK